MEKKTLLTAIIISALLFSAVAGTQFANLGKANPIMHYRVNAGDVAPDQSTKPPTILILSPENNTVYGVDTVVLSLNVSIGDSSTASSRVLEEIYYKTDWQSNNISIYQYNPLVNSSAPLKIPEFFEPIKWHNVLYPSAPPRKTEFSETINLTGIPDGNHTLMVYAVESGEYSLNVTQSRIDSREFAHYYNSFNITGCSLVRFTVDTTPPKVSILSLENKTYYSSEIQLNFTVSEKSSLTVYSLDGQKNETITGNTTLTNLPYGEHNVTVYATDMVGHIRASETIYFTIEEPSPTTMVTVPIASVAIIGSGLLVYFRKRKNGLGKKHE